MNYDDASLSCAGCSRGLEPEDLCECDDGPMCCRCHALTHTPLMVWRRTA
jgi:hypothetical protein